MERETLKDAKRLSQFKKHLFDNRKSLTEESFKALVESIAKETYTYGYMNGWRRRNEIYRITSTQRRIRMRTDFNDMYTEHSEAIGNIHGTKPFTSKQLELIENMIKDWM